MAVRLGALELITTLNFKSKRLNLRMNESDILLAKKFHHVTAMN